jgi:hypothetical protein
VDYKNNNSENENKYNINFYIKYIVEDLNFLYKKFKEKKIVKSLIIVMLIAPVV